MYQILLVEDEDIIRCGIRQSISWADYGCTVVGEARNGVEGMEQIQALHPQIVLVDLNMPILGGLEMIASTRERYDYLPIILTGYSDFTMAQSAIRCGVFDYLLKPLDTEQLIVTLRRATQQLDKQVEAETDSPLAQLTNQTPDDPIVQAVLHYIEAHYGEKITITNLVDTLHYSDRYISQKIQKAFGTTVIDYLTRYRIHQALELLRGGDLPVSDIGYLCGMGEYKYFNQVFKKHMGCSPKKYRQQKQ